MYVHKHALVWKTNTVSVSISIKSFITRWLLYAIALLCQTGCSLSFLSWICHTVEVIRKRHAVEMNVSRCLFWWILNDKIKKRVTSLAENPKHLKVKICSITVVQSLVQLHSRLCVWYQHDSSEIQNRSCFRTCMHTCACACARVVCVCVCGGGGGRVCVYERECADDWISSIFAMQRQNAYFRQNNGF